MSSFVVVRYFSLHFKEYTFVKYFLGWLDASWTLKALLDDCWKLGAAG